MSHNPWTNPTHPTAIAAMNKSHQRVYVPVTQIAQQPPASSNPWASHQPTPQAPAHYPSCYPMAIHTVIPAIIPCVLTSIATYCYRVANTLSQGFPPMQYPGNSPTSPSVQFYSAPLIPPGGANYYQGKTTAAINAENQARAHHVGAYNTNVQMVPQPASPNDQYWCRELTGHYTLRTVNTIMQSLQPGVWTRAPSGYVYWVRHAQS